MSKINKIRVGDFYAGMIGLKEIFVKIQASTVNKLIKLRIN